MPRSLLAVMTLIASLAGGCEVEIPEGRIACALDDDCPDGWACVESRCYSHAFDAGHAVDASDEDGATPPMDAGPGIDAGSGDAGEVTDAGTDGGGCDPGYVAADGGCARDCSIRACESPFDDCPTDTCLSWHLFTVPWSALPGCSAGSWQEVDEDVPCIKAADEWCRTFAGPGWLGGLGPVAELGSDAQILCFADPVPVHRDLTTTAISTFGACSESDPSACFDTIWSFCDFGSSGDAGGRLLRIRPDGSDEVAELVCFSADVSSSVTVTAADVSGCDLGGASTRRSLACGGAAHRVCVADGYISGIGVRSDSGTYRVQCASEPP